MASGDEIPAKDPKEQSKEEEKAKDGQSTEDGASVPLPEYVKHPLQNKWALWFFKNDKTKSWKANLRQVTSFDTVEDFWGVYNHIQAASKLQSGCDYSLFKEGIEPMWEDERNKQGGRWLINTQKNFRQHELDRLWLETLMLLIGESFGEYSENVCGAVVQIRQKGDKLAIWTGNALDQDANLSIGRKFKERLNLPPKVVIGYQAHEDTMTKTGSTTKSMFSL
ncbi:eukaryotic translation initiation factor 4E-like [Stylophora pistillata]|uniref:Eukaryotic translation initiation factor 4E n=1 Tax=Stylophora pistillata TaxID=50429 RepID=A0A2B4S6J0_STYPI|nr:eukaryotic translation initiation factor 4E-like [Stylophora pistillata]PFX24420.1 Eukaryotic translation initiation factor 4E [Stylophora pistillata]